MDGSGGPLTDGEDDVTTIMIMLAETAMGDPDRAVDFVAGIYKLGADVEKKTQRCYYIFCTSQS